MILQTVKGFHHESTGFTLIELAISLVISSLIAIGLISVIYQLILYPTTIQANSAIMQQAQNCSYWISRDAQMIQTFNIGDNPDTPEPEVFTFSWVNVKRTDSYGNDYIDTFVVSYIYDGMTLLRREAVHTDKYASSGDFISATDIQKTATTAKNVSDIAGSFNNNALTISVTFSDGDIQIRRTYDTTPRATIMN